MPSKQQQYNNTQYNNVISTDVVVKMINWGFGKDLAQQVISQYGADYVKDKIQFLEFEISRDKVKSPFRWLYKAIQANFSAPQGFKNSRQNQRLKLFSEIQEENPDQQIEYEKKQMERKQRQEYLRKKFQTKEADLKFWERVKDDLKQMFVEDSGIYNAYLSNADILKISGDLVYLGFTSDFFIDRLNEASIKSKIESVLSTKTGHPTTIKFEVIKDSMCS